MIMTHQQKSPALVGSQYRRTRGFTLLELMIVITIIAVLAAIAYASYQRHVIESRRKAGAACLMEVAQFAERQYTTQLTYANVVTPAITCVAEVSAFYTVAVAANPNATTYSASATPVGHQLANDTKCGTLGINQTGTKTESGTGSIAECW